MKNTIRTIALLCAALITLSSLTSCAFFSVLTAEVKRESANVSVLNGTTGFGAAKLIDNARNGNSAHDYRFTVESDPSLITAGLLNGSIDIAALPTNAAANLYNKSGGKIKIAAVNTLGVLYLMVNGEKLTVESLADLEGKTVYVPAQNPAFLFEAICKANNVNVTIDTAYAQPADLRTALISGAVDIAVLPEPMVTIAKAKNSKLVTALDLTEEWEKAYGENTLMQGCIVVRTEWAEANSKILDDFLEEYEASVIYTVKNPDEAANLIVETGVFAGEPAVAAKAIPNCNIVYIDGEEMAESLGIFFEKLYAVKPQAIGGKIPDSNIYLVK
jgi:NitT/TauT family transport system substrate-binding protein